MIIGVENQIPSCVLTLAGSVLRPVSHAVAGVGNPSRVNGTAWECAFDRQLAVTWGYVVLIGTNLTPAATFQLTLSNVSVDGTDVYDSGAITAGVLPGLRDVYHFLPADVLARYGKVRVADASRSFIDVGVLDGGRPWRPTQGDSSRDFGFYDRSLVKRAQSGHQIRIKRGRGRRARAELVWNTDEEMMTNAFELDRKKGASGGFVMSFDQGTNKQKLSAYVRIVKSRQLVHHRVDRVRKVYEVEEFLQRIPIGEKI